LGGNLDAAKLNGRLDDLGRDGWELVPACGTGMGAGTTREIAKVFKRQC
jgi:hypothetical protein